jgi:hypothetical protein
MKRLADHHLSYLADRASESVPLPTFLSTNSFTGHRQGRSASVAERATNALASPAQTSAQLDGGVPRLAHTAEEGEDVAEEENHHRESNRKYSRCGY